MVWLIYGDNLRARCAGALSARTKLSFFRLFLVDVKHVAPVGAVYTVDSWQRLRTVLVLCVGNRIIAAMTSRRYNSVVGSSARSSSVPSIAMC